LEPELPLPRHDDLLDESPNDDLLEESIISDSMIDDLRADRNAEDICIDGRLVHGISRSISIAT